MNHSEAVEKMAVEHYLLNDMGPDARDEFEEHMFDCPDCAMDVRAGVVFIDEAKRQLPKLVPARAENPEEREKSGYEKPGREWFGWLQPAFLAPVCAALLLVVGYQNLVTLPGMRHEAETPRIVSVTPLHGATRGELQKVKTTAALGLTIPVDLSADGVSYGSYVVELVNPQGKVAWSEELPAPAADEATQKTLIIPGRILTNGAYTVSVAGVDAQGGRKMVGAYPFDLLVGK